MSYEILTEMSYPELVYWNEIAGTINEEREREVERAKRGF